MNKWGLAGKILSSPRKKIILECLSTPMTPTQIAKKTEIKLSNTSDALAELVELGLAEMLTPPSMRKGKIFRATRKGKHVLEYIKK